MTFQRSPSLGAWPLLEPEYLEQLIREQVDPESWFDERAYSSLDDLPLLHVVARRETHAHLRAWIDARIVERLRSATCRLTVLEGPVAEVLGIATSADQGSYLRDDWRESPAAGSLEVVFDGTSRSALGTLSRISAFRTRPYLADVEAVCGGTGFSITEMVDPVFRRVGSGFRFAARCDRLPFTGQWLLSVDWLQCALTFEQSEPFRALVRRDQAEGAAGDSILVAPNAQRRTSVEHVPMRLDLPTQSRRECTVAVPLAAGRTGVLGIKRDIGGRALLFLGRVLAPSAAEAVSRDASEAAPSEESERETRVYPIDWLDVEGDPGDRAKFGSELGSHGDEFDIELGTVEDEALATGLHQIDAESLVELIDSLVDEDTWSNERNEIRVSGKSLFVRQTPAVLERVERLLEQLAARHRRRARFDLAFVPERAVSEAVGGRAEFDTVHETGLFDRAIAIAKDDALLFSSWLVEGARKNLVCSRERAVQADEIVNQSGVIPVINPVVRSLREASTAQVRILPVPEGDQLVLELRLQIEGPPSERGTAATTRSQLSLLEQSTGHFATSLLAPLERTVVLGKNVLPLELAERDLAMRASGVSGGSLRGVWLARLSRPAEQTEVGEAFELHRVDGSALLAASQQAGIGGWVLDLLPREPVRAEGAWIPEDDRAGEQVLSSTQLNRLCRAESQADAEEPSFERIGGTVFTGNEALAGRLRELLQERFEEQRPVLRVSVRLQSMTIEELQALGGIGDVFDSDQLEALVGESLASIDLAGFSGLRHSVGTSRVSTFLADFESVSGGTGFLIFEPADVEFEHARSGLALDVEARLVEGLSLARLELDGALASYPDFSARRKARIAGDPSLSQSATPVEIELPKQHRVAIDESTTIPLGRARILSAEPCWKTPGKLRVLIAAVERVDLAQ